MAEAQLIGRGARYNPFILDGQKQYTRRFDEREDVTPSLHSRKSHFRPVDEPQYLKNLVEALNEMNLPTGTDEKNPLIDIKVKKEVHEKRMCGNMEKCITINLLKSQMIITMG